MKRLLSLIACFIAPKICDSQNIIPNGDFEQYFSCPTAYSQLNFTLNWFNPCSPPYGSTGTLSGSPDYFNSCGSSQVSVPQNLFGFQPSHSGNGYAGFILYRDDTFFREYIEVPVTTPLIAGNTYHLQMYFNQANYSQYLIDSVGIYFSNTIIDGLNGHESLPYVPQLSIALSQTPDSLNWILLTGNYVASGGENYLLIGNFKDDLGTITNLTGFGNHHKAYYYIDDVSLNLVTGIKEDVKINNIKIFPNPFNKNLIISNNSNEFLEIIIYDIYSRKLLQQQFSISSSINTIALSKGVYLYEIRNENGIIKLGKVVKD